MLLSYQENIPHSTQSRPYSLHYTEAGLNEKALYIHCHSEMELFYLQKGNLIFEIENCKFELHEGDAIFIPPNLIHSAKRIKNDRQECSYYAMVFSSNMIMDTVPLYCERYFEGILFQTINSAVSIHSEERWQKQILENLKEIFDYQGMKIEECELMLRGKLLIIWQLLYNHHFSQIHQKEIPHSNEQKIRESVAYISSHYTEDLELQILADNAGFSEGYYCRLFKGVTGFTPFQYINRKRVSKSCEYLVQTDKKISEIATICGYNNISYYNRIFLQMMKETPSAYRNHFYEMKG